MNCCGNQSIGVPNYIGAQQIVCVDLFGCPPNRCPDFQIRRHDTFPSFRVQVEDCDGVLNLADSELVLEFNMWAKGKFRRDVPLDATFFALADNIGFEQIMIGDIIVADRVRGPEQMRVLGFDETNKLVSVQRGYNGTAISAWRRGTPIRIFRVMNGTASIESVYDDETQEDGTILEHQLVSTNLVVDWTPRDTCLPGCYWLEFKLLKMGVVSQAIYDTPSITNVSFTSIDLNCDPGAGVLSVRRFPTNGEGFLVRISDSPTGEL